jgi:hypothetical protein
VFLFAVLGKIFGPKVHEVEDCRKLQIEELYNWYASQSIMRIITSKETEMGGANYTYKTEDKRHTGCCWVNLKERKGKKQLGRPKHVWDDNINIDLI